MAEYIFRKATDADMPVIMDMQVAVFHGEQGIPAEDIKMSKKDHQQWFCVEHDGEIIGSVAGWMEENKTHMGRFVIRPDLRRQGIGSQIVRHVENELRSQVAGFYVCSLGESQPFWEKCGYAASQEKTTIGEVLFLKEK